MIYTIHHISCIKHRAFMRRSTPDRLTRRSSASHIPLSRRNHPIKPHQTNAKANTNTKTEPNQTKLNHTIPYQTKPYYTIPYQTTPALTLTLTLTLNINTKHQHQPNPTQTNSSVGRHDGCGGGGSRLRRGFHSQDNAIVGRQGWGDGRAPARPRRRSGATRGLGREDGRWRRWR